MGQDDMPVTKEYLTTLFPEFANEADARIAALDQTANLLVSYGVFGAKFIYAKTLMVAHLIALGRQKGKGMVVNQHIGDIGKGYAGPGSLTSALYLTAYGIQYLTLAKTKTAGPFAVPQIPPFAPDQTGIPQ